MKSQVQIVSKKKTTIVTDSALKNKEKQRIRLEQFLQKQVADAQKKKIEDQKAQDRKLQMRSWFQKEVNKRISKTYKVNEVHKRIAKIKETIDYKVRMEEILAQPKKRRNDFSNLERYTVLSREQISSILESPDDIDRTLNMTADLAMLNNNSIIVHEGGSKATSVTKSKGKTSKVRGNLQQNIDQAIQINNYLDQSLD